MTRQKEQEDQAEKNKRGDRKGESNDSPEIPDCNVVCVDHNNVGVLFYPIH